MQRIAGSGIALRKCQQGRDRAEAQRDELLKVLAPVSRAYHVAWEGAMDEYDFDDPLFMVRLGRDALAEVVYCYDDIKEAVEKGD